MFAQNELNFDNYYKTFNFVSGVFMSKFYFYPAFQMIAKKKTTKYPN